MDLLPWSLVLLSGLIHALWNLKVKQVANRTLYLAVAYTAAGGVLFPAALATGGLYIPREAYLPVAMSALAEALYVASLSRSYAISNLTFVYPIARGSAPVWAAAAGLLFFGEHFSFYGLLAVLAVIAGILSIGLKIEGGTVKALLLTLAVGFFIGCYTSFDRKAIELVSMQSLLFWKFLIAGLVLLASRAGCANLAEDVKKNFMSSVLTGFFILGAYSLVVLAMKFSSLGYVAAGRESGIAFATLFGRLILKEKLDQRRVFGIIIIFAGIILLKFA